MSKITDNISCILMANCVCNIVFCLFFSAVIMNPNPSKGYDRSFCVRMKSTLTKRGVHVKCSGYRVSVYIMCMSYWHVLILNSAACCKWLNVN